jgi:ligand-binding sensor domain-containing protein
MKNKFSLIQVFTFLTMLLLATSCNGQVKKDLSKDTVSEAKDTIKSPTKDSITSRGPNSIVRTVIQDRKGNIWMASWEGIFRYNGKSFTNITSKVSSARFFSLIEDRNGNFWFGTIGSGVYYYDGKSFKNLTTIDGLISNEIMNIYEDKAGNIWFGCSGGASRYDGKSFRNYTVNGEIMNEDRFGKSFLERQPHGVNFITEDRKGKFWFGTSGNTFIYDGKTFTTLTNKDGKDFKNVWDITEDRKGNIWFSEGDGLWRYDGSAFSKLAEKSALSILEDKKGNIWTSSVVGRNCELLRYDAESLSNQKPTVTIVSDGIFNAFFGVLEAFDGSIWVGSGSGVYRYDGKTFTHVEGKEGDN